MAAGRLPVFFENLNFLMTMKQIHTLNDLLAAGLNSIYFAEKQQAESLVNLARKAQSPELKEILTDHVHTKRNNVKKIEHSLHLAGIKPEIHNDVVVDEIYSKGIRNASHSDDTVADAGIAASVQQAVHYNIANYGTAAAHAHSLGMNNVAEILHDTLQLEKGVDEKITALAKRQLNPAARSRLS